MTATVSSVAVMALMSPIPIPRTGGTMSRSACAAAAVTSAVDPSVHPTRADLRWFLAQARPRRVRSMRQFAEAEVVIPDGPFAGRRFRCDRQPYTGLWFDQVDSGRWSRCVATGPTQSGKTLACFVIPILYHLFELGETVICGLPDMDMAADKWRVDLLPVIERSDYRDLLPGRGAGSRGARLVEAIRFGNGATLKFMSGGGGDKSRAGFTARVLVVTETDGMDAAGRASRESDKVTQLEARTRAYGDRRRVYLECTVSTEQGRTWREYQQGSRSRVALPCPGCHGWVTPEREHLTGWQGATTRAEAKAGGAFTCPACGVVWDDQQRVAANLAARVLHDGQCVDEQGGTAGEPPATDTLGFRWSAVNNLFLSPGELAADEWRASRAADEDAAEREMRQFVWALPVAPGKSGQVDLQPHQLTARMVQGLAKGVVPSTATRLTVGVDLGKYLCHWVAVAWSPGACGHVVDYGRLDVASPDLGVERALLTALRQLKEELVEPGWPQQQGGAHRVPDCVFVDAGYQTDVVYAFCREASAGGAQRFYPAVGRGADQQRRQWQGKVAQTGSQVRMVGEGYHASWLPVQKLHLVEVDADHWKTWVHQRLVTPVGSPGAMTLFQALPQDHLALAKHLTAEAKVEEFVPGKGVVVRWERLRRQNHYFDALYNACCAGHGVGVRLVDEQKPEAAPAPRQAEEYAAYGGPRSAWTAGRPDGVFDYRRW
jgi:phage terminase large subunit GpA-like protein